MRVSLHYFLRNIHCVNIVVMVDQVLREGRKTYYKVKLLSHLHLKICYIFLHSYIGTVIESERWECVFHLSAKVDQACMTSACRVIAMRV